MKAIFAGSFDPFTSGHLEIVKTAKSVFSEIVIAVAEDTGRDSVADLNARRTIAEQSLNGLKNISVKPFFGMLTDFIKAENCTHLVRGLRNQDDFLYEQTLYSVYKKQHPELHIIYIFAQEGHRHISGSAVREKCKKGEPLDGFVECQAIKLVREVYGE